MHTSDTFSASGIGYQDPVGHLDFYPNGGVHQPRCVIGNTFKFIRF
ncbi:unnamed protein product [Larinioides sclopetarius]|uniref:Lipase domain-containing protein n=1 Tax=Larinioides sclopetarius TaxID=280406 RepID=A0AAV2BAV8_9ARAC